MVDTDSPEERQTGSESIHIDTGIDTGTQILHTVSQGICQLDVCSSTSLLHVVAGDGDGVELRHILRRILEDVCDNLHGECGRVDISITHHELLEDIVLDGTSHFFQFGSLFQTCHDIEGEDGEYRSVHGHGDGHLVERDTIKEHLHVLFVTDAHASLTYVTYYALVVGVVATVCGQVEGNGQTFLSGSEVAAIEGIRLFGSRESGILTDGPRTEGVHHGVRTTEERRNTSCEVEMFHALQVFLGINGFHFDVFGRLPVGNDAVFLLPCGTIGSLDASKYINIFKILSHDCYGLLDSQLLVIFLECLEYVALHVNEVLNACCFQFIAAGRSSGYDEHGTVVEILEGGDGVSGIFIIA